MSQTETRAASNVPDATDPADLGVLEAAALLRERRLSASELTEACLRRIQERNGGQPSFDGGPGAVNAWARVYPELARQAASLADERLARAAPPALCGIPLALKDLYAIQGLPLTASSRVLEGHVAQRDATVWARLRDQGMVALGHTHTHEFAGGGTTDQVGNPWDLSTVAGGSSGGSAAALATAMAPAALGSDTCGSLRIPSACCATSAIKPTRGLLPLDGVIPFAATLDHPGPMARTIADCAALLDGMLRGGPAVSAISPPAAPLRDLPLAPRIDSRPLERLTIAVLTDRIEGAAVEPEVAAAFDEATSACERLGARVIVATAPSAIEWGDLTRILCTEAWAYHSRHTERADLYRPAIAEFLEAARTFNEAAPYLEAQARRARAAAAWTRWFVEAAVDLVLEPTLPIVPYKRGPGYDRGHAGGAGDPMIALTALWDMTGLPVAALPVTSRVGISLIAPAGREAELVGAAIDLQCHELGVPRWSPDPGTIQPANTEVR